jgi:hypothetical protein
VFNPKVFSLIKQISEAWKARIVALFVLAFFASIASFLRSFPFGYDSYASILCQITGECGMLGMQPLMVALLGVLPFNHFLLNLVFLFCCFASFLALFLIGLHFCKNERIVWLALLVLVGFCPFFVFHLHEWENEVFAYPLLFFGLYFLLKKKNFPAICLFGLAGLFWGGVFYVLAVWGLWLEVGWLGLPVLIGVYFFNSELIGFLVPTLVSESVFGFGLLDLFLLVVFLPFCLWFRDKELFFPLGLVVGLILVLLQGKLVVLLIPFVLLGIVRFIVLVEEKGHSLNLLIPLSFFMLFCMNISFFYAEPSVEQMVFVQDSVKTAKDHNLPLYNDWSYGYWLNYYRQDTNYRGSFPNPDYNNLQKSFIALSDQNLFNLNCQILKESKRITKIWKCDSIIN